MAGGCAVQARSRAGLDSGGAARGGDRDRGDGRGAAQRLVSRERGFPLGPRAVARERDRRAGAARGSAGDGAGDACGPSADQGAGERSQAQGKGAGGDHSAAGAEKKTAGDLPRERGRMISLEDRQSIARAVDEAHRGGARLRRACVEAGITLRTLQHWKGGCGLERGDRRPQAVRPVPAHALSEAERERILQIQHVRKAKATMSKLELPYDHIDYVYGLSLYPGTKEAAIEAGLGLLSIRGELVAPRKT